MKIRMTADTQTWAQKIWQRERLHRCLDRHVRVEDNMLSDYDFIQAVVARHNEDAVAHIEGPD